MSRLSAMGPDGPLLRAMQLLNESGLQIVLVVNSGNRLLGTVTDGDIRRHLLAGGSVDDEIAACMHRDPVVDRGSMTQDVALEVMDRLSLKGIPIVDSDLKVVGLHVRALSSPDLERPEAFLVMAGGRGERLMPMTKTRPKPLLSVGGVPLIETIVRRAHQQGLRRIIVALHHQADQIVQHLDRLRPEGIDCEYIVEDRPLGTIGAGRLLPAALLNQGVVVCNADLVQAVNFRALLDVHHRSGNAMTLAVAEQVTPIPFAVVNHSRGRILTVEEKPVLTHDIFCGVSVVSTQSFQHWGDDPVINLPDLVRNLLENDVPVGVHKISGYWRDVGTHAAFEAALQENPTVSQRLSSTD